MIHFLRIRLSIGLVFFFVINNSFSQQTLNQVKSFDEVLEALEKQTYDLAQEKVYLHFAKPYYSKGEDIWFKAYTVAGPNHTPTPLSENLYVELIKPDGQVIKRHTINLTKGLGKGDFHLSDTLAAGNYTIRAYTNWMRNFDESFFFSKSIWLLDNQQKEQIDPPESISQPIIRFFPEGGDLVANVRSRVGFEISNYSGKSPEGGIFDQSGNLITRFQTKHRGLGTFNISPLSNVSYYAQLNDHSEKFALPSVKPSGFGLMVSQDEDEVIVKISSSNISTSGKQTAFLLAHTRGLIGFSSKIEWNDRSARIRISKDQLADGIVHITLFDSQWKPRAERLIFKQTYDAINVSISTESTEYNTRDSTTVRIKIRDKEGNPQKGFFSLAAVDTKQIDVDSYHDNIVSSLLFSSDLDKKPFNPIQYLDPKNSDRYSEIDLLLMTRGWRRFLWGDILNGIFPENTNHVEQGFKISGVVMGKNKKRVKKGSVKQLSSFNGMPSFAQASIQGDGTFEINNLKYYGSDILLKAEKGNGNDNVVISLDSMQSHNLSNTIPVNQATNGSTNSNVLDEFNRQRDKYELDNQSSAINKINTFLEMSRQRKMIDSTYNLDSSRDLGQFTVEGSKYIEKNRPDRERGFVFGAGAYSLDAAELTANGAKYLNALTLVQGQIPGLKMIVNELGEPTVRLNRPADYEDWSKGPPLFLLDDSPVPLTAITALSPETIKRVEIFKGTQAYHLYGSSGRYGAMVFYSKTAEEYEADMQHMVQRQEDFLKKEKPFSIPPGYYLARQFYAPNYGSKLPEHITPDRRALIHWEPMIETDENGEAEVTFYNADLPTTIQINLEGIWEGGIPLAKQITYQVNRK